ncbi:MAG TPA: hypothetical protein VNJ07_10310, partial [Chitinophagales bacterium]|nr:hypothetical protein [Chitinophagales bacterium]
MRKAWLPVALVAALVVVTIAYIRLVLIMSNNRPVYDALPQTVSIIFEFRNPSKGIENISGSAFHEHLKEAAFFKKLLSHLAEIDTFMKSGAADNAYSTWENSTLVASMSITGRDEFDYLYVLKKERYTEKMFMQFAENVKTKMSVTERAFRDATIYQMNPGNAESLLTCAFANGLLLASHTASLVEDAIIQLQEKNSLLMDKGFSEVYELAGEDADVVLFINLSNLGKYEPLLVNEEQSDFFKSIGQFGNWMELDIKVKDNSFMINGYTSARREKTFLAGFTSEPSTQVEITHVLPHNTALFFYYAVTDFDSFMEKRGKSFTPEMENFRNWISNEWCWGMLEPLNANYQGDAFLVVRAIDPEIAAQSLAEQARLFGDDLHLEEFKTFPIGQLSLND